MATTPTNLPVPSESPRDLKFNAGKIDEFATSMGWTYTDRFGVQHYTIEGMRWLAQQAISAFGYITLDSFEDGNTLTLPNQVLRLEATGEYYRWDGEFPKTVPDGSSPESTGGVGNGAWFSVGDASLRTDLSSIDGYDIVGKCESVAQLMTISGTKDGSRVLVNGYYAGSNVGGGEFSWNASTTSAADGGYIIRPAGVTQGAWIRVAQGNKVFISEYGVTGDSSDVSNKILSAFAMANMLQKEVNLDVDYRAQAMVIDGYENVRVRGIGKGKLVDNCNKVLFTFKNCDGLDIYGIDLDGNRMNQTSTTQPGTPDGVGLIRVEQCNNWKIHHCDIHDNRLGAAVLIVDNGTNTSTNWQGSIQNGYLHKNYIHDNGVAGVVMSDGVFCWSHNTVISDNVIRRCTDYGIATDYSQRYVIKHNIISETLVGIGVLGARDALVDGNNIDTCELGIAVALSGNPAINPYISRNISICNNKIRDVVEVTALGDGIYVDQSCEYVSVNNNTVANAKRGVAVSCNFSSVSGNVAIDCRLNSFYIESKQGVGGGNLPVKSDGGEVAPSYYAGSSSKSLNSGVGCQDAFIRKNIGLTAVKICEITSSGIYSAAIVEVKFAGLINSYGPAVATRKFSVKRNNTTYSINELSNSGDSSQVIIDMNTSSGIPGVYVNWVAGAATTSTVIVSLSSSGIQDDAMFIRTV